MQKVFDNEYYNDPAGEEDEEKPVFSDSEEGTHRAMNCYCISVVLLTHL